MHLLEKLRRYGRQLENDFHGRFMVSVEDPEKENIHQLRVTIKKLKAYLQLLRSLDLEFPVTQILEPLKRVFQTAGILRDFQIHETLVLERTEATPGRSVLIKQLEEEEASLRASFQMQEGGFSFVGLRNGFLQLYRKLHDTELESAYWGLANYIYLKIVQIQEKIVLSATDEAKLHRLRINLKVFYYTLSFLGKHYKFKKLLVKRSIKYIESVQEDLGIWHDLFMATEDPGRIEHSAVTKRRLLKERQEIYAQLLLKLNRFSTFLVRLTKQIPALIEFIRVQDHRWDGRSYSQVNLLETIK
jgi:CHAD domain-containing protein